MLGDLELVDTISPVATGANDLRGVEARFANVIQRIVEEASQLAEGLGLEVIPLVLLLALLSLILDPV